MLLFFAIVAFSITINAVGGTILPKFEALALVLHVVGFFAILVPIVVLGPKQDPSIVFDTLLNEGGWPTEGLSFMLGLTGTVFVFVGT